MTKIAMILEHSDNDTVTRVPRVPLENTVYSIVTF